MSLTLLFCVVPRLRAQVLFTHPALCCWFARVTPCPIVTFDSNCWYYHHGVSVACASSSCLTHCSITTVFAGLCLPS